MHGLTIVPLTKNYINFFSNAKSSHRISSTQKNILNSFANSPKTEEASKIFVITEVIPCAYTERLQHYENSIVKSINGVIVRNMCHLMEMLTTIPENGLHKIITSEDHRIMVKHLSDEDNQKLLMRAKIPAKADYLM